ncbi:MAG: T9SS type A sorting domain-containing protein [Bacteroidia bacterium]
MMKNYFSIAILLLLSNHAFSQCSELFFSEYIEGSGNNKALEIYNPTNNPVDLVSYRMIRYDNGNITASENAIQPLPAGVFIPSKGTYVIALNLTDPNGVDQSQPIDVELQAKADTLFSNGCGTEPGNIRTMCFNGDDALTLERNDNGTWIKVDIFASIGERPSNSNGTFSPTAGWTDLLPFSSPPANYTTAEFGPYFFRYWTQDQTLVRKASIEGGVTVNPGPETFNPSVQWDSLPENTFDSLGFHTCVCNIVGINDIETASKSIVFPNPAINKVTVRSALPIKHVELYNMLGNLVIVKSTDDLESELSFDTSAITHGIYTVRIIHKNGLTSARKLIIRQ